MMANKFLKYKHYVNEEGRYVMSFRYLGPKLSRKFLRSKEGIGTDTTETVTDSNRSSTEEDFDAFAPLRDNEVLHVDDGDDDDSDINYEADDEDNDDEYRLLKRRLN